MASEFARRAKELVGLLNLCQHKERLNVIQKWYAEISITGNRRLADEAMTLVTVWNLGSQGDVNMNIDQSTNFQGPVSGSAIGQGNTVVARDITTYNSVVDQSATISPELKAALKAARQAIEDHPGDDETKALVRQNCDKLTDELAKPKPNFSVAKTLWGGITTFATGAVAIAKLGELLGKLWGSAGG